MSSKKCDKFETKMTKNPRGVLLSMIEGTLHQVFLAKKRIQIGKKRKD